MLETFIGSLQFFGAGSQAYPQSASEKLTNEMNQVAASDPEFKQILDAQPNGAPQFWSRLDTYGREQLLRRSEAARAAVEIVDSDWSRVKDSKNEAISTAWITFQSSGDPDRYKGTLANAAEIAAQDYARLEGKFGDKQQANEWLRRQTDFWNQYNGIVDPDARESFYDNFVENMSPEDQTRFDQILQTSSNQGYELYKQSRAYIKANYWDKRDAEYERLVDKSIPTSRLREYPTYDELLTQKGLGDAKAAKASGQVSTALNDFNRKARRSDPQLDALLYVWGYSEGVVSKAGRDLVADWVKTQGVRRPVPRILE